MQEPAVERSLLDVSDDPAREANEHGAERHVRLRSESGVVGEHHRRRNAAAIAGIADVTEALEELESERRGVLDDEIALIGNIVHIGSARAARPACQASAGGTPSPWRNSSGVLLAYHCAKP